MSNTDYSNIIAFYDKVVSLSSEEKTFLIKAIEPFSFKKKQLILEQGKTSNYVYFVNRGVLRAYHIKDGDEVTTQFYFPNSYCSSYESFLTQSKGRINIQSLTECEVLALSYNKVQEMYKMSERFNTFGRRVSEMLYIDFSKRTTSLLLDDTKTRYLNLIKERPEVLKTIPNYMIASYIGISAESLSRLKKQLCSFS